jgi:very-short-patch-repair endonuclease
MARAQRFHPAESVPFDSFSELDELLFRQEGVISRLQARTLLSRSAIEHRLGTGQWRLVHRAVYVTAAVKELSAAQRRWVAALAVGEGRPAALGGLSALHVVGLRAFDCYGVHVVIPGRYRDHDPPPFAIVHRVRAVPPEEVHHAALPPCTVPGRSVLDAGQWAASDNQAAAIVAASFQQRLVTFAEVERAASRQVRARRRSLVLEVARDAAGGAHSLPEVEFLRLCRRARLPQPRCQVARVDGHGARRYLDAYFEEYSLHVEIDGRHHAEANTWWADMRRQNDLWIAGDRILRFPSWIVRHHPTDVARQLRAALLAAGWTGVRRP